MPEQKPPRPSYIDSRGRIQSPAIGRTVAGEPIGLGFPSAAEMGNLSDSELDTLLRRYGVQRPWTEMQGEASDYVRRMSTRLSGDEQEIADEVQRITAPLDKDGIPSRRGAVSLARRTSERWSTLEALETVGDPNHEFIRVSEGDDAVCDSCAGHAGSIGTLQDHEAAGLPGAASCDGGDQCRCQLVLFK